MFILKFSKLICGLGTLFTLLVTFPSFVAANTLLLREPAINGNTLVFTYGQEVWQTDLNALDAQRITRFHSACWWWSI
jgi:tricorn protease